MDECKGVLELISRHIDGDLSETEAGVLLAHLDSCNECREKLEAMRAMSSTLADLSKDVPKSLAPGVLYKAGITNKKRRLIFGPFTIAAAAAAIVFFIAGTVGNQFAVQEDSVLSALSPPSHESSTPLPAVFAASKDSDEANADAALIADAPLSDVAPAGQNDYTGEAQDAAQAKTAPSQDDGVNESIDGAQSQTNSSAPMMALASNAPSDVAVAGEPVKESAEEPASVPPDSDNGRFATEHAVPQIPNEPSAGGAVSGSSFSEDEPIINAMPPTEEGGVSTARPEDSDPAVNPGGAPVHADSVPPEIAMTEVTEVETEAFITARLPVGKTYTAVIVLSGTLPDAFAGYSAEKKDSLTFIHVPAEAVKKFLDSNDCKRLYGDFINAGAAEGLVVIRK